MTTPEFSRTVRLDTLGSAPRTLSIEAKPAERAALAKRFGLVALDRLTAEIALTRKGDEVTATGTLRADATQSCAASGEPVPESVEEAFTILFRSLPQGGTPEEEIELAAGELDVVFYDSAMVDVGEGAAETLALALNPYPRSPAADEALKAAGVKSEEEAGPFAALAALKDKLGK